MALALLMGKHLWHLHCSLQCNSYSVINFALLMEKYLFMTLTKVSLDYGTFLTCSMLLRYHCFMP